MSFDRKVARLLDGVPLVRKILKIIYLRSAFLIFRRREKIAGAKPYEILKGFFGYYDSPAINDSSTCMLFQSVGYSTKIVPDPEIPASIHTYNFETREINTVAHTYAYNWQQGARLQWITDTEFIYNDFDANQKKYISYVRSIGANDIVKKFDYPVQDSFKEDYFLSLNYRRLFTLRKDYGYWNLPEMTGSEIKDLKNDGISKINYSTGEGELLISLEEIVNWEYKNHFDKGAHYLNHVMISPDGEHIMFIHRYFVKGRRFDRLMCIDKNAESIKVLAAHNMVSHCTWANSREIIGYLRGPDGKDRYYQIDINHGKLVPFQNGILDLYGDGHPHVQGSKLVTDTYPDKSRMQSLIMVDLETGKRRKVAELFHGFDYTGISRCDLHPRLSPDGKYITVDTVFDEDRKIAIFETASFSNE